MKSIDPRSKYFLHKADTAWGQYVHARYNRCAVNNGHCSGPLEAHHLITRGVRATRHDPANSILLCARHHRGSPQLSPHGAPTAFREWLQVNLPDKFDWMTRHQNDWKTIKADYRAAYERLMQ
jgi:hypothetical protein